MNSRLQCIWSLEILHALVSPKNSNSNSKNLEQHDLRKDLRKWVAQNFNALVFTGLKSEVCGNSSSLDRRDKTARQSLYVLM